MKKKYAPTAQNAGVYGSDQDQAGERRKIEKAPIPSGASAFEVIKEPVKLRL